MNNQRRKSLRILFATLSNISTTLETIQCTLDDIHEEEDEAFNNIPESLEGSERYEDSQNALDCMETALEEVQNAIDSIEEVKTNIEDCIGCPIDNNFQPALEKEKFVNVCDQQTPQKIGCPIKNNCQPSLKKEKTTDVHDQQTPKRIRVEKAFSEESGKPIFVQVPPKPTSPQIQIYYVQKLKKGMVFGCCFDKVNKSNKIVAETGKYVLLTHIKGYVFPNLDSAISGKPIGDLSIECEDNIVVKLTAKQALKALPEITSLREGSRLSLTNISNFTNGLHTDK